MRAPTKKDKLEYWVVRGAMGLLGALPRGVALRIGALIGEAIYAVAAPLRRVAMNNLARAFPDATDADRRDILRRSCRNLGRLLAEVCHFADLTGDNIGDYVTIDNPDLWQRMLDRAATRGSVVLTAHFGNFELLAQSQALRGHPVTLVHRTMRNPLVDQLILDMRETVGTKSLPKKSAARTLLRALRHKEIVALPADQNQPERSGVFADFFGVPACTTPGPARLAAHTGAPIVPVFLARVGESARHRLIIYPDVELADTGDPIADMIETTARCNRAIERILTEHPDQWIWFHKRWKTRPEGEPKLY